jgi:hypothetical protein
MLRRRAIVGRLIAAVLIGAVPPAHAQSAARGVELSAGGGWGSLWDDETMLGRGLSLGGGVARTVGDKLRLAADVDWLDHDRDSGYLASEGRMTGVFGRATYLFRAPSARVRPLAGASLGLLHSTGTLTMRSFNPLIPQAGQEPDRVMPWSLTRTAFDIHGGVGVRLNPRVALRPEVRWRATFGSAASTSLEPPLVNIETLVYLDVRLGPR